MNQTFVYWSALVLASIFTGIGGTDVSDDPVVDTPYGRLIGTTFRSTYSAGPVYAFLGVPYAQPPVGDLRLALPKPVDPWTGDRSAITYEAACPQNEELLKMVVYPITLPDTPISEDCLYLDIYTPGLNGKRDVLVFIHGGGFILGKSSMINGTATSAYGDIVFVSINYRLGLLGMLQNFRGNWPSNLGLRDQQFALRWVQENIAAFGGDPDKVTIAGESAGATAVSFHILSPSSQGLFQRAIMQSGSALTISTTTEVDLASIALTMLGCMDLTPEHTLACLRNKSADDFVKTGLPGAIMLDDEIIPKTPEESYQNGKFSKVDLLLGVVGNEGFVNAGQFIPEMMSPQLNMETFQGQLAQLLGSFYGNNIEDIHREIVDYYFGGSIADKDDDFVRRQTAELIGMMVLTGPTHLAAKYHSEYVPNTFFYHFAYQPRFLTGIRPSWHNGECDHGFELLYTLGMPSMGDFLPESFKLTEEDDALSVVAMEYWTNFVKTGNPNGHELPEWKPFTDEDEHYLVLNSSVQQASVYRPEDMAFWNTKIRGLDVEPKSERDEL